MTHELTHELDSVNESRPARCIVCLKALGPDEALWTVHFRGSEHTVCCPSCVQQFNRSPAQFLQQP